MFWSVMALETSCTLELDALLADGEIAVIDSLRDRVEAIVVVEVYERAFAVLQLIQRWSLFEMPA